MKLIFDYGHGINCGGKCSPDHSFYEWKFNRKLGMAVAKEMRSLGYDVYETWTEDKEPLSNEKIMCDRTALNAALMYRVRKVNEYCKMFGTSNCISISFHANAAGGDGQFHTARGFTAHVGKRASEKSKKLARCIYDRAFAAGFHGNRSIPDGHYWVQGLAMCDQTNCPAVLTESLFYDNKEDLELLKSDDTIKKLVHVHIDGILDYLKEIE